MLTSSRHPVPRQSSPPRDKHELVRLVVEVRAPCTVESNAKVSIPSRRRRRKLKDNFPSSSRREESESESVRPSIQFYPRPYPSIFFSDSNSDSPKNALLLPPRRTRPRPRDGCGCKRRVHHSESSHRTAYLVTLTNTSSPPFFSCHPPVIAVAVTVSPRTKLRAQPTNKEKSSSAGEGEGQRTEDRGRFKVKVIYDEILSQSHPCPKYLPQPPNDPLNDPLNRTASIIESAQLH